MSDPKTKSNAPTVGITDSDRSQIRMNLFFKSLNGCIGAFDQAFQEHLRAKGASKQTRDARSNDLEIDGNESVNLMEIFEADESGFWSGFWGVFHDNLCEKLRMSLKQDELAEIVAHMKSMSQGNPSRPRD
ncbi:hypothetical protein JMJ35_008858 [Cladonia borealis]|uniref:Uncharacterized protein n=1 Tax=Cladonia borealis TaxID=184061 RepID=A0AA39QSV4_9LECA|nr:hypothetical protein JMJ35_008858 [Cladonia borealis]